jgi:predicted aminopeptidase
MASYGEADLADTIIHEMTHASAFAKASASRPEAGNFNEELATFVGRRGALLWLESSHGPGSKQVEDALRDRVDRAAFASWLAGTAAALQAIYSRSIESAEKRRLKAEIISARAAEFEVAYDALFETTAYRGFPMGKLNNAYLDLYRLYEGESALYEDYLSRICGSSLRRFVAAMSRIASGKTDPKAGMRAELAAGAPR